MRTRVRIDNNQKEITKALRQYGASVHVLSALGKGCPDLLVGFRGRNFLFEIKQNVKKELTPAEKAWHLTWAGDVDRIDSIEDALIRIGVSAKTIQGKP